MQVTQIQEQKYNSKFSALTKIKCNGKKGRNYHHEKLIIEELKKLASEHDFFKKNDVNAMVSVEECFGARVVLASTPIAKGFWQTLKNMFASSQIYIAQNGSACPNDSTFFLSRKIRDVKENKREFADVFIEKT